MARALYQAGSEPGFFGLNDDGSSIDKEGKRVACFQTFCDNCGETVEVYPWQPMETAPKDGTPILIAFSDDFQQVCKWDCWPVGGENPVTYNGITLIQGNPADEYEEGWVAVGDGIVVFDDEQAKCWMPLRAAVPPGSKYNNSAR